MEESKHQKPRRSHSPERDFEKKSDDDSCEDESELDTTNDEDIEQPSPTRNHESNISPSYNLSEKFEREASKRKKTNSSKISHEQTSKPEVNEEKRRNNFFNINYFWFILVVISAVYIYTKHGFASNGSDGKLSDLTLWNIYDTTTSIPNEEELIENFKITIDDMAYTFKKQHSYIWDDIYAGIVDIMKHPEKRSIIFLFSNHDQPMFCLAHMIGNATKEALRTDNNLWITPSALGNNYGLVIHKFRELINQQKIVIIENLLNIHPEAMRAFHNFCDSENPVVRQTVYIFTMIAEGYKRTQRPIDFIEKQLEHKLKGKINPEKIQPLITRITDGNIIPVQPEPDLMSCPLRY